MEPKDTNSQLTDQFRDRIFNSPDNRMLIVPEKFQAGFDRPLVRTAPVRARPWRPHRADPGSMTWTSCGEKIATV